MKSLVLTVAALACTASVALAQQDQAPQQNPPQGGGMRGQFMEACGNDMQTYCASAQTRDDRRSCMMANMSKFSDQCKGFMANHPMHQHPQGQMQGPQGGTPQP